MTDEEEGFIFGVFLGLVVIGIIFVITFNLISLSNDTLNEICSNITQKNMTGYIKDKKLVCEPILIQEDISVSNIIIRENSK